ncbi:MAG: hypothetical protein AAB036_06680 [Elusimicrobiota bacterium]
MGAKKPSDLGVRLRDYSHYTEIKQLAYTIAALQQEKKFNSLAVLSFYHGEGKTLLCAALALAYAETSRSRVLIVDTTLLAGAQSLSLSECLPNSENNVKCISLAEQRRDFAAPLAPLPGPPGSDNPLAVSAADSLGGSEFAIITNATKVDAEQYGLVLLDTMPLTVKNKNNFDPRLVARLANASILVVSQQLLDAGRLDEHLKMLQDPSLNLIGMISNEEFTQ